MFHQHSNHIIILTTLLVSSFFLPSVTSRPQCFAQPAPGRPPLLRADLQDCLAIADIILKGDKAHAPMHWSRVSGMGWRLPTLWDIWGSSCFVSMDMLPEYEGDVVVFAPDVVAKTAVNIINWCQTSARLPRLGGREETGPELKTIVIMAGKVPEEGPRPPGHPRLRVSFPRFNSSITITAMLASTYEAQTRGRLTMAAPSKSDA